MRSAVREERGSLKGERIAIDRDPRRGHCRG